ncbi:tRNA (adenosine(37)-N6)-threonylcarbamoyltransferase complex transferase subunit TsaD [Marinicauda salina]|uniref:tRNA N6-adenosine threonylcarbamoyltransferase n=1 Tax=Marinicauda salina TaxID=2135793 RepID=A0A2U2BY15_9PROT|nr:tRNA (adenosine(37)-N6)-threonylcarbamoyltransferase complex transferase subunit TsaD [Marinicauda salina]
MALSHPESPAQARARSRPVLVLGLESSCDDSAAAIVRRDPDGAIEVVAEIVVGQNDAHAPYGGVVPEIAARAHAEVMDGLAARVLDEAGLTMADIDAVAATAGPGLIGGVMAALMTAKGLALGSGKPLIAVNHLEGHALSPRLVRRLEFPWLLLLVSGGHTQLLSVEDVGRVTRLGSTIDDAAGEAFDKTAKIMGLGFPGGPAVERLASEARDPGRFALPRMLARDKSCDFSFAGLKTAARRAWESLEDPTDADRADLAAAVQAAIAAHLAERAGRAMERFVADHPDAERVFVAAGGVAANAAVRAGLEAEAADHGFAFVAPPLKYCTDNAAMIALAGAERFVRGEVDDLDAPARARWPLDGRAASSAPASGAGRKGPKA